MKKFGLAAVLVASLVLLLAVPAEAYGGTASPNEVTAGGTMIVTGDVVPPCGVGDTVILQGNGVVDQAGGYIAGPIDANGRFTLRVTLSPMVPLGSQTLQIRCAAPGEPLHATAGGELGGPNSNVYFTVVGLASTGGSIGPVSYRVAAEIALALVASGFAALVATRRRKMIG